jgi:hypothetical protein
MDAIEDQLNGGERKNPLMKRFSGDRYGLYFGLLIFIFIVVHLVINSCLGIHIDEASWWFTTKHLAPGYFWHPPFITYELFIITKIFGDSVFSLRLGSLFFTVGSLLLVHSLSLELFKDRKWAFIAALVFAVLPITSYWLMLGHQDAPFIFFWLLSTFLVWRALSRDSKGYWYLAGISTGFMLLCKLQAALFLPCLLLFLLISKKYRHWLIRKEPYLALLIVLLMFTPTIIWYASYDFEPITYQLSERPGFVNYGVVDWFVRLFKHVGWEMIVLSPFIYLFSLFGMIYGGWLAFKEKDQRFLFLFWLSVPLVVFFTLTGGAPYWSFPGHICSLLAAVGALPILLSRTDKTWLKRSWKLSGTVLLVIVPILFASVYIYGSMTINKLHEGWEELAMEVEEVSRTFEDGDVYVAGPYHFLVNPIAYYVRDEVDGYTLVFRDYELENFGVDSDYPPYVPLEDLVGEDFIFIDERENPDTFETPASYWEEKLPRYFDRVEGPIIYTLQRDGQDFRTIYIFECYGFKGPDENIDSQGDIRSYVENR